jgi:aminoglycoside 6'-N-acetyltransferase I
MGPRIRVAEANDWKEVAALRAALWPEASYQEHLSELEAGPSAGGQPGFPVAWLVAEDESEKIIGFLEVGLRSHADGCDPRHPVGFVEGWFVREEHRGRGIGTALMRAAEDWSRAQGCVEMASDALIDNAGSESAHKSLGFEIVDRCIHFRKHLS